MATLNMDGPFRLDGESISKEIGRTSAGNYALGRVDDQGTFRVKYVGRADSNLKDRLKQHVTESYTHFKFSYATSPKAAFEKECQNYHDFGANEKLDNKIHPDRPSNSKDWSCPVCTIFD